MIDKSKTYRTRDGREVRIYATDGYSSAAIHGAYKDDEGRWLQHCWHKNGKCYENGFDLIEVRPRHKRTVWLHVFQNSTVCATEEAYYDITNRIACIKVELDFEEGEGL